MEFDNVNFSEVMEYVVNKYNSRCYIDNIDSNKDVFLCPCCKEPIYFNNVNGMIEKTFFKDNVRYKCPICRGIF